MRNKITSLLLVMQAGVVVGILLLLFVFTSAPEPVQAGTSTTPASIFTGRFIPAFIGGAYDPSVAYSAMAGLPVYVVAFQDWQGASGGGNTFLIGDRAVRTQIRADGTFQVQGVPEAAIWGVYFPFTLDSTTNVVERTDCTTDDGSAPDRSNFSGTGNPGIGTNDNLNPCKAVDENNDRPFYMPRPQDRIVDVFSYAAEYLTSETSETGAAFPLRSQVVAHYQDPAIPTDDLFENVAFEHAFLTNRKELDVENNINTFPLMPSTTIKVGLRMNADNEAQEYEVWAIRVSDIKSFTAERYVRRVFSPIIKGRAAVTNRPTALQINYGFTAYAPRGDYVVIAWRRENNSPSYSSWNGSASLSSHAMTMGLISVDLEQNGEDNWRDRLSQTDTLDLHLNNNFVWGMVTTDRGELSTAYTEVGGVKLFPNIYLEGANIVRCIDSAVDPIDLYSIDPSTLDSATFAAPEKSVHNYSSNFKALRGVYIVRTRVTPHTVNSKCSTQTPHSARVHLQVDTDVETDAGLPNDLRSYRTSFTDSGTLFSMNGPQNIDIKVGPAEQATPTRVISGGYDSGIYILLNKTIAGVDVPFVGTARVIVANSDEIIPAKSKTYVFSDNGELHIPPADLIPQVSEKYEDLQLIIIISDGLSLNFFAVGNNSALFPWWSDGGTGDNTSLALLCNKTNPPDTNCSGPTMFVRDNTAPKTSKYNLAVLNDLTDLVDNSVYAVDSNPIPFNIIDHASLSLDGNINVEIREIKFSIQKDTLCDECEIDINNTPIGLTKGGGTLISPTDQAFLGGFEVIVPRAGNQDYSAVCKAGAVVVGFASPLALAGAITGGCDNLNQALFNTRTYTVQLTATDTDGSPLSATREISVDQFDVSKTELPDEVALSFDCKKLAKDMSEDLKAWEIGGHIEAAFANITCSASQFFAQKISVLFGLLQDYGLQVPPLTKFVAVGKLHNISRNLVNVMFIVIFIIMTIMTILRFQPERWHVRVILPKMLIALALANFSILIVQAVLDLNNFATETIFNFSTDVIKFAVSSSATGATSSGEGLLAAAGSFIAIFSGTIVSIAGSLITFIFGTGGVGLIGVIFLVVAVIIVLLLQAIMLMMVFLMRMVALWLLFILAPFVFFLSVTPWFEGLRDKWFSMLTKISFIQTQVAGLLAVGLIFIVVGSQEAGFIGMISMVLVGVVAIKMAVDMPKQALASAGISQAASLPSGQELGQSLGGGLSSAREGIDNWRIDRAKENARWDAKYEQDKGKPASGIQRFMRRTVGGTLSKGVGRTQVQERRKEMDDKFKAAKRSGETLAIKQSHEDLVKTDKSGSFKDWMQKPLGSYHTAAKGNDGNVAVYDQFGKEKRGTNLAQELIRNNIVTQDEITKGALKDYKQFASYLKKYAEVSNPGNAGMQNSHLQKQILAGGKASGYSRMEEQLEKLSTK